MFWEPQPEEHPLFASPLMTQNVPQALFFSAPPLSGIKSHKSCRACGTCLCSKPQLPNMTASPPSFNRSFDTGDHMIQGHPGKVRHAIAQFIRETS